MLLRDANGPGFANHDNANLAGILHLVLDLLGDIVCENGCLGVRDLLGLDHDVKLATSLHGIGALDAVVRVGDLLELFKTLYVVLSRLSACARASSGNGVCRLDQNIKNGVGVDIGMVSLNGVDNLGALAIATGKIGSDNRVRALNLVVNSLAEVVKKAGSRPNRARKP